MVSVIERPRSLLITPASSARWYGADAFPVLRVPNKSRPGKWRNVTIKDARKLGLVPSVTTVLAMLAKPSLEAWQQSQLVLSALTLPKHDGESQDAFAARVVADAQTERDAARDAGQEIHKAIHDHLSGRRYSGRWRAHVLCFEAWLDTEGFEVLESERRFVSPEGYAGTADIIARDRDGVVTVLDVKTRESAPDRRIDHYREYALQLAGYAQGLSLDGARLISVAVSRNEVGRIEATEWSDGPRWRLGWFATLTAWKAISNFGIEA